MVLDSADNPALLNERYPTYTLLTHKPETCMTPPGTGLQGYRPPHLLMAVVSGGLVVLQLTFRSPSIPLLWSVEEEDITMDDIKLPQICVV